MIEEVGSWKIAGLSSVEVASAREMTSFVDFFVTDPPYADAINYHEITEFFIAWLRKNPPPPFDQWTWDSRRDLAIKGKDEHFRRDMVAAYAAMTKHMPDNGLQAVMFTHQDAGVWADLGAILWAAGLSVTAAWNVATETASALKEGNYVQGTICLVLRKRRREANARRMEIEAEIEEAVAAQIARLTALDDGWHVRANAETLYTDGDLTLAAYAAALQVVTAYSTIDRQPLDRDLYRKLAKNERTMMRDLVDYAAQVANGLLVPEGFPRDMWRDLGPSERFYVRMLDMEAKGATKVADFQNFAKSFAFADYASLMGSTAANAASLAGAGDLKGRMLDGDGFAKTQLRQVLFAVWKALEKGDPKLGVTTLRTEYTADYWQRRPKLIGLVEYVAAKTNATRPEESAAAHEVAEALKLDRV
jgi:putative DNA methylase